MNEKLFILGNYYSSEKQKNSLIQYNEFRNPHFIIHRDGYVEQTLEVGTRSNYVDSRYYKGVYISIAFMNLGHLNKEGEQHYDMFGNLFVDGDISEKKFKGVTAWETYTDEQLLSASKIIKKYAVNPKGLVFHSIFTKRVILHAVEGIYYRCNFHEGYYDVNPTFDTKKIKTLIDNG